MTGIITLYYKRHQKLTEVEKYNGTQLQYKLKIVFSAITY